MTTVSEIIDYIIIRDDPASLIILRLDVAIVTVFLCRSVGSRRLICSTIPEPATENVHFYWDKQIAVSSVHPSNLSRRVIQLIDLRSMLLAFLAVRKNTWKIEELNRFGRSEHSVTL